MDLKKIEKLMELMRRHGMNEVEVEDKVTRIKVISSGSTVVAAPSMPVQTATLTDLSSAAGDSSTNQSTEAAKPASSRGKPIKSPFVGTFYESSSPDSAPYVKVGQRVNKGDVLCIIEAMKLMNEIECEQSGTIIEILANNGEPVQFDQELFVIE